MAARGCAQPFAHVPPALFDDTAEEAILAEVDVFHCIISSGVVLACFRATPSTYPHEYL